MSPQTATILFNLTDPTDVANENADGAEAVRFIEVHCPVCGDGYLTDGEACDYAAEVGQPGYDPACTFECELQDEEAP